MVQAGGLGQTGSTLFWTVIGISGLATAAFGFLVAFSADRPEYTGKALLCALASGVLAAVIAYETRSYGAGRDRVRHEDFAPGLRAPQR